MLVLSRRPNETIRFPHLDITIKVVRTGGKNVKLGVEAPKEFEVLRGELAVEPPLVASSRESLARKAAGIANEQMNRAAAALDRLFELTASFEADELASIIEPLLTELKTVDLQITTLLSDPRPTRDVRRMALLVDDNPNETRLLASYLRLKGFDTRTASNGADAMHYLCRHEIPDVMVLDMNMPRFNGSWTVSEVRSNPKYDGMKIFSVSGIHPAEYGVELGPQGVDRWFRKPLNPEDLVREIELEIQAAIPVT